MIVNNYKLMQKMNYKLQMILPILQTVLITFGSVRKEVAEKVYFLGGIHIC